jgi:hypothetical protein
MRQIGSHQNYIAGVKTFDMIAHELGAAAPVKIDQLHFRMIMPAVVYERIPVLPDTEGMRGRLWDFQ